MPQKIPNLRHNRRVDNEDMFVSADERSITRGRRAAPRTQVCRPALIWQQDAPDEKRQGVVLDLNPRGMRIRMLEQFEVGTELMVQLMRDDGFREPLSRELRVRVVRTVSTDDGFVDHGVQIAVEKITRTVASTTRVSRPVLASRKTKKTRMYSLDYTIDENGIRRSGRDRG